MEKFMQTRVLFVFMNYDEMRIRSFTVSHIKNLDSYDDD